MEFTTTLTILLTTLGFITVASIFAAGFLTGRKFGSQKGYDQAIKDLLLTKNPEAWEMARMLQIDLLEQLKTEKLEKLRRHAAPTETHAALEKIKPK